MRILAGSLILLCTSLSTQAQVTFTSGQNLPAPAVHALKSLELALKGTKHQGEIIVGIAGQSPQVDRLIESRVKLPDAPESLAVKRLDAKRLLIAGRDARGLAYALRDVARAIECGGTLDKIADTVESPFLAKRTVSVHLFNADLEARWYFDEAYWKSYFAMLSLHRFNNLTLTFCDQTNYLCPLYSNLLEVPGFPGVRVKGITEESRKKQLGMLKRIAELAHEHGLDFTLGLWQQVPVAAYPPKVEVEGLPAGLEAAGYCAAGLKAVLRACPAIDGVQLRMNAEAGVAEAEQTNFYRPIFHAIRDCGRSVRVELRYKGLTPATTQAALDAGLKVTVSTKFWAEHFGLPYHATAVDSHYAKDRYGFGSVLDHSRKYDVVFQHWTAGSQRITLWGDPDYAAKFARACKAAGGTGYEVFAPLTNRGYGNDSGKWDLFPAVKLTSIEEQDRYWYFYLSFGRLGFNPASNPEVWQRELRARYRTGAEAAAKAYASASKILPLITSTRMPSASEWSWWPEMDTGDPLPEYARTQPGDTRQFYAIRTWERTPKWRAEAWDSDVPGYVEDAIARKVGGKWTPWDVARELSRLGEEAAGALKAVSDSIQQDLDPRAQVLETATEVDLNTLSELAKCHAAKTRAATHLSFFEATGETGRLSEALQQMKLAENAWDALETNSDFYGPKLVFGTSPLTARNKFGHHHSGNWSNRLPEVRADVAAIQALVRKHGGSDKPYQHYPGESGPAPLPRVVHSPSASSQAGRDVTIEAKVTADRAIERVVLHHRPMDQTAAWSSLPMAAGVQGSYSAVIPGRAVSQRRDHQYYFEVLYLGGGGRNWPNWQEGMPYVIVRTR